MLAVGRQTFDCRNLGARDERQRRLAGSHGLAVKMYRARPAETAAAAVFGPGQAEVISQRPENRRVGISIDPRPTGCANMRRSRPIRCLMIKITDLRMSYPVENGSLDVLSGVNMTIADGETVAIVGPSGSGKTTLLILLAGLEPPAGGSIELDGENISALDGDSLADIRRDKLGIVFQSFHLVPSLTALGNVSLPVEIGGREGARESARKLLQRVGLMDRENHYPSQLSGGEQQRVAIARAVVHSPSLVLADEPTGNLDIQSGAQIIEMLFELNAESGSTMVLVTHDTEVARRCQRVFHLTDGKLIEDEAHVLSA